jgi:hypothetical protein
VRGSSVGVSEAAKKSVPKSRPAGEKERHRRTTQYRIMSGLSIFLASDCSGMIANTAA